MTPDQIKTAESIAVAVGGGLTLIFPVSAPLVVVIEKLATAALEAGITPTYVMSAEQASAQAAGIEALKTSAVTSDRAHHPTTPSKGTP